MKLGTALWMEGISERLALVTPLPDGRLADLNRIEHVRLAKLGEGAPDRLAAVLVPPSLRQVLEGGPRAFARVKQTVQYAEKWARRGDMPDTVAYHPDRVRMLRCLTRPSILQTSDGLHLDRLRVFGTGVLCVDQMPEVGLAAVGQADGEPAGFCLAARAGELAALGTWMQVGEPTDREITVRVGTHQRSASLNVYGSLDLPPLRPAEVFLLPPLRFRALPGLEAGGELELISSFDTLTVQLGPEALHGTVQ